MRKTLLTLTAAALVLGVTALSAGAQTQAPGAGNLQGQAHNFTPLVKEAACNGMWGPWCGPGWVRRCWRGPYGGLHCRCVRCW
jgi:hypothetical protein